MALIIENEPMPECCFECPCCRYDNIEGIQEMQCNLTLNSIGDDGYERRMKYCPLKEYENRPN